MVNIKKDSQGRYVVSHIVKYGEDKGKLKKHLHFNRLEAINQAAAINSINTKKKFRRKLK